MRKEPGHFLVNDGKPLPATRPRQNSIRICGRLNLRGTSSIPGTGFASLLGDCRCPILSKTNLLTERPGWL